MAEKKRWPFGNHRRSSSEHTFDNPCATHIFCVDGEDCGKDDVDDDVDDSMMTTMMMLMTLMTLMTMMMMMMMILDPTSPRKASEELLRWTWKSR